MCAVNAEEKKNRQNIFIKDGEREMRFAISTDKDEVSAHFGRCPSFTIIDVEDNRLIKKEVLKNPGHQPGFIPEFLSKNGVQCVVAGGMGPRAIGLFGNAGIRTIVGVSGSIDDIIDQIVRGALKGGESLCKPGAGKGYGIEKTECTHEGESTEN